MSDRAVSRATGGPQPPPEAPNDLRPARVPMLSASLRAIGALTLREVATRYGRNPGGFAWAVLEPAAGIAFLCLVFQAGFRAPPLGTSFALFYATGILPFFAFLMTSTAVAQALNRARPLMAYPRISVIDVLLSAGGLAALVQLAVGALILAGILAWDPAAARIAPGPMALAYLMALSLGFGIGTLLALPLTFHPLWQVIWSVLTRPLIIVSGVIILQERLPDPWRGWLEWNPLVHVTGAARRAAYPGYAAEYLDPVYVFALAGGTGAFGLLMLIGFHRAALEA
ncbi:ABC transporter permease [Roseivivax sp.]